jgi:hypothetical protein
MTLPVQNREWTKEELDAQTRRNVERAVAQLSAYGLAVIAEPMEGGSVFIRTDTGTHIGLIGFEMIFGYPKNRSAPSKFFGGMTDPLPPESAVDQFVMFALEHHAPGVARA